MGTRHHQVVIDKEGNMKLMQYGQWDGYPSGQGVNILRYLKNGNLEKYQENLSTLREPTVKEIEQVNNLENWERTYPYMSRNCGSNIHQMIESGEVKFVGLCSIEEANKWCEGFYTIDFQKNEFTSEFHGAAVVFPINNLPSEGEYLKAFEDEE